MSEIKKVKIGKRVISIRPFQEDYSVCWICKKPRPCNHYGNGGRSYVDNSTSQTIAGKWVVKV